MTNIDEIRASLRQPEKRTLWACIRAERKARIAAQAASGEKEGSFWKTYFRRLSICIALFFGFVLLNGLVIRYSATKENTPSRVQAYSAPPVSSQRRSEAIIFSHAPGTTHMSTDFWFPSDPVVPQEMVQSMEATAWLSPSRYAIMASSLPLPFCASQFAVTEAREAWEADDAAWLRNISTCSMLPANTSFEWTRFSTPLTDKLTHQIRVALPDGKRVTGYIPSLNSRDGKWMYFAKSDK